MATTWFQGTVRYERCAENGMKQKVTEQYLVDAVTFTDAESILYDAIRPYVSGEMEVKAIKKTNFAEVFSDQFGIYSEADAAVAKVLNRNANQSETPDKWFSVKVNFISIDEKTAKEKKTPVYYLANANTTQVAQKVVELNLKGTISDYAIEKVVETKILEVVVYNINQAS
jgi:hypothetical protein